MTLGEFAYVLDVEPKWVQNAAATVEGGVPYTLAGARRTGLARALIAAVGMQFPTAFALAADVLRRHDGSRDPVQLADPAGTTTVAVDVYRVLAAVNAGVARLRTMYAPRRRGRPAQRVRDPLVRAADHGLDLSLLAGNLRRTPAERLRQLDAMSNFRRRVRRGDAPETRGSHSG